MHRLFLYMPTIIFCITTCYCVPFFSWLTKHHDLKYGYAVAKYNEKTEKYEFLDDFKCKHYLLEDYREDVPDIYIRYKRITPDVYKECFDDESAETYSFKMKKRRKKCFVLSIVLMFVSAFVSTLIEALL